MSLTLNFSETTECEISTIEFITRLQSIVQEEVTAIRKRDKAAETRMNK